jgi:hypothetical protein
MEAMRMRASVVLVLAASLLLVSDAYLFAPKPGLFSSGRPLASAMSRVQFRGKVQVAPRMNLGTVKPSELGIGKAAPANLHVVYDAANTFVDGEIVVVKRGDGGSCFGRIEPNGQNQDGSEYMICVDETNGKFVKESPKQIGKIPKLSPVFDHDTAYFPPARMHGAHIDNFAEYKRLYQQSLDDPVAFWTKISDNFHWETRWHTLNKVNFDTTKGPVSIEW